MQLIINFFEYTLSGGLYFIYFVIMIICSLACVGVVGEKVSKRKQAELIAKREALAKEESEKAKEMVKKQAESYGVNNVLDPTAKKAQASAQAAPAPVQQGVPEVAVPVIGENSEVAVEESTPAQQEVIVFDAPATSEEGKTVDNVTPIVDNTSEDAVKASDEVPSMLVINDDGSSNVSA